MTTKAPAGESGAVNASTDAARLTKVGSEAITDISGRRLSHTGGLPDRKKNGSLAPYD